MGTRDLIDVKPWILPGGGALDVDLVPECWERTAHIERYEWACRVFRDMRIVDFGCGVGYGTEMLTGAGNRVVGIDSDPDAIVRAITRRPYLSFLQYDPDLLAAAAWDGVVAFEVLEHLEDPGEWIQDVRTRNLLVSVPVLVEGSNHHKHQFTIDSIRALIETRFAVVSWWIQVMPFHNQPAVAVFHGAANHD